jgi:hypothetical protein
LPDRLGIEFVLALEVTIEAAMGKSGGGHDFIDRDLGKALSVEQPRSALEDALPCVRFVLWGIRHRMPSSEAMNIPE